jgi:predicted transcriptional regulator
MTEFDPDWTVHPGETLREWREENGLGVKAAATTCGRMDPVVFSAVESGKRRITKTIRKARTAPLGRTSKQAGRERGRRRMRVAA